MRSITLFPLISMTLLFLPVTRASGQRRESTWQSRSLRSTAQIAQIPAEEATSMGRLVGGGVLGGLAGVAAGVIAYQAAGGGRLCGDDPCGLWAGVLTTVVLEPVLIPTAVHLADHRRGNAPLTFLASIAAGVGGLMLDHETRIGAPMVVLTPVVQIVVAALVERATSH